MIRNYLDQLIWVHRTSITELARKSGVSPVTIRKIVKNSDQGMSFETALKLAKALHEPVGELATLELEQIS